MTLYDADPYDKIKSALAIRDSCKKNIDLIRVSIDGVETFKYSEV